MKMQKLDSKQVPQVVILGVLAAGVFGYGAMQLFGGSGGGQSAPPATKKTSGEAVAVAKREEPAPAIPPPGNIPGLTLPGQYNPDPFRPSAQSIAKAAPKPAPAPKASPATPSKEPAMKRGPLLPADTRMAMALPPSVTAPPRTAPAAPVVPAGPVRPAVVVTGTSLVEGADTAIVEMGQEHRVVQVGDLLTPDYRVKKIEIDGIVLVSKKDRFFVGKGTKGKSEKTDGAALRTVPVAAPPGVLASGER